MYLGKIVEIGTVRDIFHNPTHPYTLGLMNSIPSLATQIKKRLVPIEGIVPDLVDIPKGCGFSPRCPRAKNVCSREIPVLQEVTPGHRVACWLIAN
ncbi:MAG: oligopeptide/dipeptide ABC transporter ATP-binding protein, partial [Candidatus Latescibacterota bacterium]